MSGAAARTGNFIKERYKESTIRKGLEGFARNKPRNMVNTRNMENYR